LLCLWVLPVEALPARTLLVVGDSLSAAFGMVQSAGWVALLEDRLVREKRDYKVVNASVSGDTTAGGAARLPRLLAEHRPTVVIIELGGNDGLRGLPAAEIRRNLTTMVSAARASGARVLLVGMELPPNYGRPYLEKFRAVYADVARRERIALAPFPLAGIATDQRLMLPDRIHPTAAAQPRLLDNLWPHLKPLL